MELRKVVMSVLLIAGTAVLAEGVWQPMTGEDIRLALTGKKLQYTSAWQEFRASGRTLYNAGQDSWGYWRVEGDQYCSMWPPSDLWACYRMERSDEGLRFIGASGEVTDAIYAAD